MNVFLCLLLPSGKGETTTTGGSLISSATGETGWINLIPFPAPGSDGSIRLLSQRSSWERRHFGEFFKEALGLFWGVACLLSHQTLAPSCSLVGSFVQVARMVLTATCKFTSDVRYWLRLRFIGAISHSLFNTDILQFWENARRLKF